jgi:hypothetical protein
VQSQNVFGGGNPPKRPSRATGAPQARPGAPEGEGWRLLPTCGRPLGPHSGAGAGPQDNAIRPNPLQEITITSPILR